MSRFKVGQKVVCIADNFVSTLGYSKEFYLKHGYVFPQEGDILTIRDIFFSEVWRLRFEEVVNPKAENHEPGFAEYKFAPIEEYTDSVSIAQSLVRELTETDKAKNPVKELV